MPTKTYTVRIARDAPEVVSDQTAKWLEATPPDKLAADPGAGERTLRLSLDADKVKAGAQAAGEAEAVFLRRLIASNVRVPEEASKPEPGPEPKPKAPVLTGALRLQPEQVMPLVRLFEVGQGYLIRSALHTPEATRESAFTTEERELLAKSTAEVINRRVPLKYLENADVIGLAATVISIEAQKIEAVQAVAERKRALEPPPSPQAPPSPEVGPQ